MFLNVFHIFECFEMMGVFSCIQDSENQCAESSMIITLFYCPSVLKILHHQDESNKEEQGKGVDFEDDPLR